MKVSAGHLGGIDDSNFSFKIFKSISCCDYQFFNETGLDNGKSKQMQDVLCSGRTFKY